MKKRSFYTTYRFKGNREEKIEEGYGRTKISSSNIEKDELLSFEDMEAIEKVIKSQREEDGLKDVDVVILNMIPIKLNDVEME